MSLFDEYSALENILMAPPEVRQRGFDMLSDLGRDRAACDRAAATLVPDDRRVFPTLYHQSYQVRRIRRTRPNVLLRSAPLEFPAVHLFDEPQFNTQDGYIGFMLDFFRRLRAEGRLVFVCLHPTEAYHLQILRELAERWVFVDDGRARAFSTFRALAGDERGQAYLGRSVAPGVGQAVSR